ncbi:unnamed protein product [Sphagnum balticum]
MEQTLAMRHVLLPSSISVAATPCATNNKLAASTVKTTTVALWRGRYYGMEKKVATAVVSSSFRRVVRVWCENWKGPLRSVRRRLVPSSAMVDDETRGSRSVGNMAVLLEVDGVLADIHKFGHRNGFNVAFQELGLDCANWTEPVYADLLRQAGGIEETMLTAFFDRIGWPSSLPTNEKDAFVRKVMQGKHRALEKIAASGGLPLRPSIEQFIDEVLQAQVPLLVLSAHSKSGEQVARSLIAQMGPERESLIKVVGEAEVKSSAYGQLVLSAGTTDDIDEQLSIAASKAVLAEKQRIAEEVASILKVRVEIDTNFTQISRKTIAVLRAAAEIAGLGVDRCILLAGSLTGVQAASRIDMPCVVVRSSGTARAEFPLARATLEDFGAGAITLARLQRFIYEQ